MEAGFKNAVEIGMNRKSIVTLTVHVLLIFHVQHLKFSKVVWWRGKQQKSTTWQARKTHHSVQHFSLYKQCCASTLNETFHYFVKTVLFFSKITINNCLIVILHPVKTGLHLYIIHLWLSILQYMSTTVGLDVPRPFSILSSPQHTSLGLRLYNLMPSSTSSEQLFLSLLLTHPAILRRVIPLFQLHNKYINKYQQTKIIILYILVDKKNS